jgi:multiple sugar transport system substrate-binding protein
MGFAGAVPALERDKIVINTNTSDPAPRAAFSQIVEQFRTENPDTEVVVNFYDHESYKTALRGWLTSVAPDVVLWFAGNRMRQLVELGLLADVSDVWTEKRRGEFSQAAIDLVSVGGRQYGVPYTSYNWGLYFRRDLLNKADIKALSTWQDLLDACDALNGIGIAPIAIGTKDLWPAAGWFDYLNLRVNGFRFHSDLVAGRIPFTDPRVLAVFDHWAELVRRKCFVATHVGMSWQEAQALLYQGRAAMMHIGSFIVPNFLPEVAASMELAPFPTVNAGVPVAEDAPTNSVHVPVRAGNPEGGKRFLAFMMRADIQETYNRAMNVLPVNRLAAVAEDRFLQRGREILASAADYAQFFDRDTNEELAAIAMRGFQEFMVAPERRDAIMANIERARQRIFVK